MIRGGGTSVDLVLTSTNGLQACGPPNVGCLLVGTPTEVLSDSQIMVFADIAHWIAK